MARYNQWQNKGLRDLVKVMNEDALRLDRGAFFSSIFATLNHLLWGDRLWMSRFDPSIDPPDLDVHHTECMPNPVAWSAERFRLDGLIREWARAVKTIDLTGDLSWYSGTYKKEFTQSKALCITHFFNHQTHHRGQIHTMMTAAGQTTIDTDLIFMPEN